MKVVSVCSSDWANFAYNFSEALKSVGVDSYSYCLASHPFGYPKQSEVVKIDQLKKLTEDADFIVVHHSCSELLPHLSDRKIIHYAAGTKYRQEHDRLNKDFKDAVTTFIALPEFQYLVPNDKRWLHYVVGAVDTDYLRQVQPVFYGMKAPIFGHFPSNPTVKGTSIIDRVVGDLPVSFISSKVRFNWEDQIRRMAGCDIIIELLAPEQGGKPYGSFGITALEAAALGKIVITQNLNSNDIYFNTYGGSPMDMIKDADHLRSTVEFYSGKMSETILNMQELTRNWVEQKHSYKATGERVLKILNGL